MEVAEIFIACKKEAHYSRELILQQPALVRVISGEVRIAGAGHSHQFFAGDTALLARNQLGRMSKLPLDGKPCIVISLLFRQQRLRRFYEQNPANQASLYDNQSRRFQDHPLLKSLFDSLLPYFELNDVLPAEIADIKVEEAIRVLRAVDKGVDGVLAHFDEPGKLDLIDFMERNFMFNLSLEKFGYLTGRSLTTFKKDFNNAFHDTPGRWLTRKRLELAHYQIFEKNRKPSEVYLEVGFEDLSHFSFAFKKYYGYNPTAVAVLR